MVTPLNDGYPHHWAQGPRDLVRLYAPITYFEKRWEWQVGWFLETPDAVPGVPGQHIRDRVHYYLNLHGLGWHRSGVYFSEVEDTARAHVVLRLTDAPPVHWPDLAWGPGWAYYDGNIGKRVAQITSRREQWYDLIGWVYLLNMELGGHCTFDMWDHYIPEHEPYTSGCMGGWAAARASFGMPSNNEIASAKAWLKSEAYVDEHSWGRIVGAEGMPAPHHIDEEGPNESTAPV